MIFLQAAARPAGPAAACLQAARDGRLELVISPEIVAEVRDVLTRPKTLRKFQALTVEAVDVFVRGIVSFAVTVSDVPSVVVLERDPKDEPYLNLAIASGAAYLATWDKDLLDLMGDEGSRQQFPTLTILEPPALLRALQSEST
jgi:putative PIN family toxin of toxin-antitoxin system